MRESLMKYYIRYYFVKDYCEKIKIIYSLSQISGLINNILGLNKFTMTRQRILTLLLITLENLVKKQTSVQQMYGKQSVDFVMKVFAKCLYQENENFQVDQR